jgi:hypothetical protein
MSATIPLNPLMCEWTGCLVPGYWYLLYGCLNGHVQEGSVCKQHYTDWGNQVAFMLCGCGLQIDMYLDCTVRSIHGSWTETLLRDQSARKVSKHFKQAGVSTQQIPMCTVPIAKQNGKNFRNLQAIQDYYKHGKRNERLRVSALHLA